MQYLTLHQALDMEKTNTTPPMSRRIFFLAFTLLLNQEQQSGTENV